jgi:hypothetical protein
LPYDDIAFDHDEDDEFSDADPDNDLPQGFSPFHSRFPSIVSEHFREVENDSVDEAAASHGGDLEQRFDRYIEALMHPRR